MKKKLKYISLLLVFIVSIIVGLNHDKINVFAEKLTFESITKDNVYKTSYGFNPIGDDTGYFIAYKDKEGNLIELKYLNYGYFHQFDEFYLGDSCADLNGDRLAQYQPCQELYKSETKKITDIENWYVEKAVGNIATDRYIDYGYETVYESYTYLDGKSYYNYITSWGYGLVIHENETIAFTILFDEYKKFIEDNNHDIDLAELTTSEDLVEFYYENMIYNTNEIYYDEFIKSYGEDKYEELIAKIEKATSGNELKDEFAKLTKEASSLGVKEYTKVETKTNDLNSYFSIQDHFYEINEEIYDNWDNADTNTALYVLKELSAPTFTIDCEPTKIAKDEKAVCTLKVNANQKVTKIEGNIDSEHLIVDSVEDQNGWKSTKDDSGKYTITHPDGVSGESDVLKINISTDQDDDIQTKLVLSAVKYTDITGDQEHADVSSNIDIVKIPPTGDYRITFMIVILISVAAITVLLIIQKNKKGFIN